MVWQIITWWAVWLVGIILYKSIGAATARQTLKSQCNDWWDFPGRVIFSEWKNIHNLKPGRCDRLSLGMGTCVKKKVAKICSTYNQKVLKKETFSSSRRAKRHIRVVSDATVFAELGILWTLVYLRLLLQKWPLWPLLPHFRTLMHQRKFEDILLKFSQRKVTNAISLTTIS